MSEVGACSCSLQGRLHQVENARSREMKAHGELVQELQHELESRRTSEAETRLMAAKLRTDKCCLEAEVGAANTKLRQQLQQLDAQRTKSSQLEDECKAACNESERRLQVVWEANNQLLEEKRQLNIELSVCRSHTENVFSEKELLMAKNEELCAKGSIQAVEIEKCSAAVASKQQEIEAFAARSKLLFDDLTGAREQQNVMQGRLLELEREVNHTLVMRNRALHWRRKHQEMRVNRVISHEVFLIWKSISVQAKFESAAKMAECNERNRGRLQLVEQVVLKCCSQAKAGMQSIRQACDSERMQIQSLRGDMCQVELPKLQKLVEILQKGFSSQREGLEVQLESQRVCLENQREQLDFSRQEADHRLQKMLEAHKTQLARVKRQKFAAFQALATKRQRESQHRTFNAWKELYLRSIVGQATHTAMIFSSQQPTVNISNPSDDCESNRQCQPLYDQRQLQFSHCNLTSYAASVLQNLKLPPQLIQYGGNGGASMLMASKPLKFQVFSFTVAPSTNES